MGEGKKQDVITFKVDDSLREALEQVPNRSEFIRSAIQAALEGTCPLCRGTGTLSPKQRRHWEAFARGHALRTCEDCHAVHLVCLAAGEDSAEPHAEENVEST
jgi:hypothetical protein